MFHRQQTVLRTKDRQKYVERQSIGVEVLVWKYHVFTFLMVLGNTWIYLNNYQTLATTHQYERKMILVQLAASKQRQRGRRLRAMTATKSQGSETCVTGGRKLYVVQESNTERKIKICHAALLLFFVQYCNKILFTRKNLSLTVVRIKMVNFRKKYMSFLSGQTKLSV